MTIFRYGQQRISEDMARGQVMSPFQVLLSDADIYTSSSYNGDSFSTQNKTLVDVSASFVKRTTSAAWDKTARQLYLAVSVRDSGAGTTDCYIVLGDTSDNNWGSTVRCPPADDRYLSASVWVPCNADGDFYLQAVASGASTLDLYIQIVGYRL